MTKVSNSAVHVLLFECQDCGCPFPEMIKCNGRNLEELDACGLWMECHVCQWAGNLLGINATRHFAVISRRSELVVR